MNKETKNNPNGINIFYLIFIGIVFTFLINYVFSIIASKQKVPIGYNQFISLVENGVVDKVQVEDEQLLVFLKQDVDSKVVDEIFGESASNKNVMNNFRKIYYTGNIQNPNLVSFLEANNVYFYKQPVEKSSPILGFILSWIFPFLIFAFFSNLMRQKIMSSNGIGGMMNVNKSGAKLYNVEKKVEITFKDVAGQEEAKESLEEIIDFLHNPEKYTKIGAKQPKGALLIGPPGTGKTLLAKAVSGEAKVPFFSLSGSAFVEMFVGVGASRVRDLFEQANKMAPCIIFIDELDAIGKSRDNQLGSNDEREQTLNQLLAEMDGFDSSKGIIVLAATNRPEILDKALLRPGRFDRQIIVERPDLNGRESILKLHSEKVNMDENIDLRQIAFLTNGASGADLANLINEAALRAVRMKRDKVTQDDLTESVELIIAGKEMKARIMSPKEKKLVAYHEVGHALASALQKNSQPVQKITIVPRTMGSLGYTLQMPEEEKFLITKDELLSQIVTLLSGRAAEETEFNLETTGASNDIERATQLSRSMVTQYGMSEKFGMMNLESTQNKYLSGNKVLTCSEYTGKEIDDEVKKIIETCYNNALGILKSNRTALTEISEFLYEKETISGVEFMEILNKHKTEV